MVVIALAALAFITVQVVLAAEPVDSVTLPPYRVELVTYTLGTDTSTWVYAVTALTDTLSGVGGLSHWTLGVDLFCYTAVEPTAGSTIQTPTGDSFCTDGSYTCQSASYRVELGTDPTLGIGGVKWETLNGDALEPGEAEATHIFALQVAGENQNIGESVLGLKTGTTNLMGVILGPVCSRSAVGMTSVAASSGPRRPLLPALVATAGTIGTVVSRKRRGVAQAAHVRHGEPARRTEDGGCG